MRIGFVALVLFFALAGVARAGTYDVVACGSAGANRSWEAVVEAFPPVEPQPGVFEFDVGCATGMRVSTFGTQQRRASYSVTGSLRFTAPTGTKIVAVRAVRHGSVRSSSDDPGTEAPENGDWDIALGADGIRVGGDFGAEQCFSEPTGRCDLGTSGGSDTGAIRIAPAADLKWSIGCGGTNLAYCFTTGPGSIGALGFIRLRGVSVTLEDLSNPSVSLTANRVGWVRPSELIWSASDNSGIRSAQILVDGREVSRIDSLCDFTVPVPCPNHSATAADLGAIADGRHAVTVRTTDSAGNVGPVTRTMDIDGNGPAAVLRRASRKSISVGLSDEASGVAGGTIEVRNRRSEAFRPLQATLVNGRLTAHLDRGNAARVGIRVTATDLAGNVTRGQLSELSVRVDGRRLRRGATAVRYGRSARFTGTLRTRDGVALARQPIRVEQTLRTPGAAPAVVATVTTNARGRFSYRAPAGVSRVLRLVYAGGADLAPLTRTARMQVRASSTIRASRRVLRGSGRVRFSGRLGLRGAKPPKSGKIVELQAFDRGRWRTFATTRARGSKGRWSASYRFGGTPGRYPVRLRIRREAVFPYELGYSRRVVVRVIKSASTKGDRPDPASPPRRSGRTGPSRGASIASRGRVRERDAPCVGAVRPTARGPAPAAAQRAIAARRCEQRAPGAAILGPQARE